MSWLPLSVWIIIFPQLGVIFESEVALPPRGFCKRYQQRAQKCFMMLSVFSKCFPILYGKKDVRCTPREPSPRSLTSVSITVCLCKAAKLITDVKLGDPAPQDTYLLFAGHRKSSDSSCPCSRVPITASTAGQTNG